MFRSFFIRILVVIVFVVIDFFFPSILWPIVDSFHHHRFAHSIEKPSVNGVSHTDREKTKRRTMKTWKYSSAFNVSKSNIFLNDGCNIIRKIFAIMNGRNQKEPFNLALFETLFSLLLFAIFSVYFFLNKLVDEMFASVGRR